MTSVRSLMSWFDEAYPPALAEDWDRVGLDVGSPDASVSRVGFAVDVSDATIAEAREQGAELLITHHPLLLRGVHAVRADEPKGRQIMALLDAGIAHFCAHTNADHARDGVSDALAEALGIQETRPLVPLDHDETVGTGRVGVLATPLTAGALAKRLAGVTTPTTTGVRLAGDPARRVETVAVCGGAGDAFLDAARAAGVDAYVTSDLRHHVAQDFAAWTNAPVLIDVAHSAAEALWLGRAQALVERRCDGSLTTYVSTINTDPWTLRVGGIARP